MIPSGSMKPTLLVQDYVMVKKWAYGLRIPFSEKWLIGPALPGRGDVVVFKSKEESGHFMVKRVVGLPGDEIEVNDEGKISVNGKPFAYGGELPSSEDDHIEFEENNGRKSYRVRYMADMSDHQHKTKVPAGEIFFMGDNRDHSMDSRFWGSLPINRIVGQVSIIWMSCEDNDEISSFLCSPEYFRRQRIFTRVR